MKKALKYGLIGAAAAAVAAGLFPFELKKEENGDFSYQSLLLGITKTTDADGQCDVSLSFFNLPPCCKKDGCITEADFADISDIEEAAQPDVDAEDVVSES